MGDARLTIVPDELHAEMLRAALDAHGIACVVRRPALGEVQWGAVNVGMGGPREIIVRDEDLDAARRLLEVEEVDVHLEVELDASAAPGATEQLASRHRQMSIGWAVAVIALFGVPIALMLTGTVAALLDAVR